MVIQAGHNKEQVGHELWISTSYRTCIGIHAMVPKAVSELNVDKYGS